MRRANGSGLGLEGEKGMKEVTPSYYKKFECIGSLCKHSCCIGWEIDIDGDTAKKYENVGGVFGKRLQDSIDKSGECPHFILGDKERCPFLNKNNLCDIIINLGEGYLCEICDAHPRFKNYFSDRVEIGLGLCCEEACRIILSEGEPFSLEITKNNEPCGKLSPYEKEIISERDSILLSLTDRRLSIEERIERINSLKLPEYDIGKLAEYLLSLEILSDEWRALLERAKEIKSPLTHFGYEKELEALMCYFVYRYVLNEDYDGKSHTVIAFSLLCSRIITTLWSEFAETEDDKTEICRLFSQEIEYSTENVSSLMSLIEEYNEI